MEVDIPLFERLGREKVLLAVVEEFYSLILQDPLVSEMFAGVDMVRLRQHQLSFLSALLGGPESYTGRSMHSAHRKLQLQEIHFNAVAEHMGTALRRFGVGEEDVGAVLNKLAAYKSDIVAS